MVVKKEDSEQVAKLLLKINAIKLQPSNFFTWSSGKKSPIYCDNRLLLSHVQERAVIKNLFCKYIRKEFTSIDYIAGVATGAIPHGMMVAEELKLPFIYIRSSAKGHGRQNQIEGKLKSNSNVLVIEDLISTGKSSLKALDAINEHGAHTIGLISIFTYDLFNPKNMEIACFSLCNYGTLIQFAIKENIITSQEKEILKDWHSNYSY